MAENEYLDFSDLENLDDLKPDADDSSREKFPCERCAGTGHYQGHRVHQEQEQCFQCKGKGYFYTSYKDRRKRREQTRTRKVNKLQKTRKGFEASNPGMTEFPDRRVELV